MNQFLAAAKATPKERDRFVDFIRVFSIGVVVLGHWFMAVPSYDGSTFTATNALSAVAGLWIITWVFQVMPLFFFVGGFSNAVTVDSMSRKGLGYVDFMVARLRRILRPVLALLAVWCVLTLILTGAGFESVGAMTKWITQPLWFVAVYLAVVAISPLALKAHRRFGLNALVVLGLMTVAVDALRFGAGIGVVGAANLLLVWAFAQQIGFFYADGSLQRLGRNRHLALAGGGLALLILLVTQFGYPGSMVGQDGDKFSNMSPPTLAIPALTIFQVGLAMTLRPLLIRRLQNAKLWAVIIAGNTFAMTLYLWHLTALIITVLVVYPLGWPQPDAGTLAWFATRPLWFAIAALPLAGLVLLFARFDSATPVVPLHNDRINMALVIGATALTSISVLGLALTSLNGIGTFEHGRNVGPVHPTATFAVSLLVLAVVMIERGAVRRSLPQVSTVCENASMVH